MAASRQQIEQWLKRKGKHDTHMLVVTDTFEYSDYPVFVDKSEDVQEKIRIYNMKSMQRVTEVYDLSLSTNQQLNSTRAWNV